MDCLMDCCDCIKINSIHSFRNKFIDCFSLHENWQRTHLPVDSLYPFSHGWRECYCRAAVDESRLRIIICQFRQSMWTASLYHNRITLMSNTVTRFSLICSLCLYEFGGLLVLAQNCFKLQIKRKKKRKTTSTKYTYSRWFNAFMQNIRIY